MRFKVALAWTQNAVVTVTADTYEQARAIARDKTDFIAAGTPVWGSLAILSVTPEESPHAHQTLSPVLALEPV